ncbi:TIGR02147 family protein [Bdellovibrio sp. HCB337]|uniref:TIGR02147 family protein n=1 Tax=Bdellovibrio sp. HCB337 TaxID=3394358 RepID=UPI0039A777CB
MDYRRFLKNELQKRQMKNRSYSMRAFSRDLGVASSRLSEILNGKVGLSERRASSIADRLELGTEEKNLFIDMVESEHSRSAVVRAAAGQRLKARFMEASVLGEEEESLLSDWHHLAILELLNVERLEHSVTAFAKRLKVEESSVAASIEVLTRLGYIAHDGHRWTPTEPDSTTTTEIPSKAIRDYHTQMLEKAHAALHEKSVKERDFSSMVFAMNKEQLDHAKLRLQEFRRTLVKELESIPGKDSVYCLSLNLFSLTGES